MINPNEIIEARLAAYIDGDLSAADRAEIEAYLRANPEHQRSIEDMTRVRAVLRAVPREKAPPEVLDQLQTHLERSALLDASPVAGRIYRWSQWSGAAAVLLLTAGLGVAIFKVLPDDTGDSRSVAVAPAGRGTGGLFETPDTMRGPAWVPTRDETSRGLDLMTARAADGREDPVPGATVVAPRGDADLARSPAMAPRSPATVTSATPAVIPIPPPERDAAAVSSPVAVVIETDDPAISSNLIAGYFVQNRIEFDRVDDPARLATLARAAGPMRERTNVAIPVTPPTTRETDEALRIAIRQQQHRQVFEQYVPQLRLGQAGGLEPVKKEARAAASGESLTGVLNRLRDDYGVGEHEVLLIARGLDASQAAALREALTAQRSGLQATRFIETPDLLKARTSLAKYPAAQPATAVADAVSQAVVTEPTKAKDIATMLPDRALRDEVALAPARGKPQLPDEMKPDLLPECVDIVVLVRVAKQTTATPSTLPATRPTTGPATAPLLKQQP